MFEAEAERLLRTKWLDPNMLAQELYAIFSSSKLPLTQNAPITINNDGSGKPGLTLGGYGPGQPAIQIKHSDGSVTLTIGGDGLNLGGLSIQDQGAPPPFLGSTNLNGPPNAQPGAGQQQQQQQKQSGGGGFAGTVQSNTDTTALVQLTDGSVVTAEVGQLAPGATIPVGTFVLVVQVGDTYYCQPPVWGPPS